MISLLFRICGWRIGATAEDESVKGSGPACKWGCGLFAKTHEMTLTGLAPNTTYYFIVLGADRSGNQATSFEYQFRSTLCLYLPAIFRRR